MSTVHERFDLWAKSVGGYRAAAALIGCDPGYPHKLAHDRKPGLPIAHSIERATSGWEGGQIRTEDWCPTESTHDTAPAGTFAAVTPEHSAEEIDAAGDEIKAAS